MSLFTDSAHHDDLQTHSESSTFRYEQKPQTYADLGLDWALALSWVVARASEMGGYSGGQGWIGGIG